MNLPNTIANETLGDADKVQENFIACKNAVDTLETNQGAIANLNTTATNLVGAVNEVNTAKSDKTIQVTGKTLSSASWSLVSGLYEQSISDANITADSIVLISVNNADRAVAKAASICTENDSSAGSVKVYAENEPTGNIGVTLNITEKA